MRKSSLDTRGRLCTWVGIDAQRNCHLCEIPGIGLVRTHSVTVNDNEGAHTVFEKIRKQEGVTDLELTELVNQFDPMSAPEFLWEKASDM